MFSKIKSIFSSFWSSSENLNLEFDKNEEKKSEESAKEAEQEIIRNIKRSILKKVNEIEFQILRITDDQKKLAKTLGEEKEEISSIRKENLELKLKKITNLKEKHFESKAKLKAFLYNFENIYRSAKISRVYKKQSSLLECFNNCRNDDVLKDTMINLESMIFNSENLNGLFSFERNA